MSASSSSIGRRSARSPTNRSNWSRTSPRRPSSPSRTRDCSTSCVNCSQQQTATADVLKVSQVRPVNLSQCSTPSGERGANLRCQVRHALAHEGDGFRTAFMVLPPAFIEQWRRRAFTAVRSPFPRACDRRDGHSADMRPAPTRGDPPVPVSNWPARGLFFRADVKERRESRRDRIYRKEVPAVHGQSDRSRKELRRPGGHRHREHAPA